MSNAKQETVADIVNAIRNESHAGDASCLEWVGEKMRSYADHIEAAEKRKVESIHRAMVIIAGIEMESSEDPPRLWTALEDAYDALCDALETDGETTADEEEAKATGRHFVVKSPKNAAAMREALEKVRFYLPYFLQYVSLHREDAAAGGYYERIQEVVTAALSAPPRNCDVGTAEEQSARFDAHCRKHMGCFTCPLRENDGGVPKHCEFAWSQMPYKGGAE